VAPLLLAMLFAIIEFGLTFRDVQVVCQAAREGVRAAAMGDPVATIASRVRAAASAVDSAQLTVTCTYRTTTGGVWSEWRSLGDSGTANDAPTGAQVKVAVQYPHRLISGVLTSQIADTGRGYITLAKSAIALRE
jgi:Flp pilus assembly protein TadG